MPTPKAIIEDCKRRNLPLSGTLFGEVRDLYNSLNFYQQQKYFTKNYIDIDDLAGRLAQEHKFPYEGSADFLTDFAQNVWGQKETRFSFADTPRPTDAEIAEAQRQKDEVKAKWTNPDGTMKKGYHCAPNGKPSRLSEEQWLLVRTPNFKKWFGDWEKSAYANAAMDFLEKTAPVKELSGKEFQKDGVKLTEKVPAFFKSINNVAHNEELGDVVLDLKGVEDSVAHGVGRLKAAAFMAVPEVIEKGFIFSREKNWKNRNWDSAVLVAPVKIGTEDYVCEVVVKRDSKKSAFYLHEVEIKKTLEGVFKSVANNGYASQVSKLIFGKYLTEVKGNVSQVVDENGEPLVVYHGTDWKPLAEKAGNSVFKDESYFTASKTYANRYKKGTGEIYDFFLNIKKPFDTRNPKEREIFEKEFYGKWGNGAPLSERGLPDWTDGSDLFEFLQEKGYDYDSIVLDEGGDGGYGDSVSYRGESYVPLKPNQIKSATDNVGTYSENPDIRWSIREDSEAEKIDTQFSELYERYKNGDKSAYEEAAKLVADYAESKGYDVKVYHGTGADGFNVAKADASEAKNGEGMQAHGMGLYLATKRSTADKYRENADRPFVYTVKGIDATKLGFDDSSFDEDSLYELFWHAKTNGFDASIAETEKKISSRKEYIEEAKKSNLEGVSDLENALKNEEVRLKAFKQLKRIFNERGYTEADIDWHCKDGKVFDWFTNLKPNEVIDENKPLSEQPEIWKKFKNAWIDMWAYVKRKRKGKRYWESLNPDRLGKDGNRTAGFIFSRWSDEYGSAETINLLLRNGIYGIVYDGGLDGRCYVSFEGGSAVKLQDPFTFDDNGELIPLSQRFDSGNPDMRFSFADNATLNKLRESKPIEINSKNVPIRIGGSLEMRKQDALKLGKSLRGIYRNKDTKAGIQVVEKSVSELLRHDVDFKKTEGEVNVSFAHLLSVAKIPEIIKNAIYIKTIGNEDPKNDGKIDSFDYYLVGLKVDEKDYTVKMVVANATNGEKYYDHALTKIEKGKLIWHSIKSLSRGSNANNNLPYGVKDKRLANLLQENKSEKIDFSFADNPIHQKKRELAIKLAKDMYKRLGDGFDPLNPEARREVQPTQEEREGIYMEDLAFLDEDVDDVCNKAEAILWKLVNGTSRKTLQSDFDRMATDAERGFEYSRIVEACVKDALKDFKKELNLSAKIKEQEQRDTQREADSVKGFTADELAINGMDLIEAITEVLETQDGGFEPDAGAINTQIDAVIAYCKNWATAEGVSYDLAFAKMRATLVGVFNDVADRLVYGKHVKSACKAIFALTQTESEKSFNRKGEEIGCKVCGIFLQAGARVQPKRGSESRESPRKSRTRRREKRKGVAGKSREEIQEASRAGGQGFQGVCGGTKTAQKQQA